MFKKRQTRENGLLAQALVLSAKPHSHRTSNEYQRYDFVREIRPKDQPPFLADLHNRFWIMERKPAEAEFVQVKYAPQTPGGGLPLRRGTPGSI